MHHTPILAILPLAMAAPFAQLLGSHNLPMAIPAPLLPEFPATPISTKAHAPKTTSTPTITNGVLDATTRSSADAAAETSSSSAITVEVSLPHPDSTESDGSHLDADLASLAAVSASLSAILSSEVSMLADIAVNVTGSARHTIESAQTSLVALEASISKDLTAASHLFIKMAAYIEIADSLNDDEPATQEVVPTSTKDSAKALPHLKHLTDEYAYLLDNGFGAHDNEDVRRAVDEEEDTIIAARPHLRHLTDEYAYLLGDDELQEIEGMPDALLKEPNTVTTTRSTTISNGTYTATFPPQAKITAFDNEDHIDDVPIITSPTTHAPPAAPTNGQLRPEIGIDIVDDTGDGDESDEVNIVVENTKGLRDAGILGKALRAVGFNFGFH